MKPFRLPLLFVALVLALTGCRTSQPEKVNRDLARLRAKAESGDAHAQYELGRAYADIWNPKEASRWYRKAAEQGVADAQYLLGQSYATGEGAPRDNVEAYAWFCLAAAQQNRQAMNARGKIVRQMSRAEVEEANRRAYEYVTKYPAAKGFSASTAREAAAAPDAVSKSKPGSEAR
jgi:TPR repeat protein